MLQTAKFLNRSIKAAWSSGKAAIRPLWQGARRLAMAGLLSFAVLVPQVSAAQTMMDMNTQTTNTYIAFYASGALDGEAPQSWEDSQRAAAIGRQMVEQNVTSDKAPGFVLDETRVTAFIEARAAERDAMDAATTPEQRWKLAALQTQAEEQGLPGYLDTAFVEDTDRTAELVAKSKEKADQLVQALVITVGGAGALGLLGLAMGAGDRRRRTSLPPERTPPEFRGGGGGDF
ncbi:MAG: hypothetical protein Alpg2KO_22680 [Alphaproteobacteria bacterium]